MKKRIAALLLSVVLCFGLAAGSLAAGNVTLSGVSSGSRTVTVRYTGLEAGKTYYLCSAAVNGELVWAFDLTAEASGGEIKVELDAALGRGDTFAVNIPGGGSASRTVSSGGGGGGGGGGGSSSSGKLTVVKAAGGSVTARPSDAREGELVTLTVRPDSGYVLKSLTVTTGEGRAVRLTRVNETTYTFIMPGSRVTVTPVFESGNAGSRSFSDVPEDYTFYADIAWAAECGFMGGYGDGTFRPRNNTTRQALWMVLARIDGKNPSSMAEARDWAVASGVSDGSNASAGMTRQQMVTMLYRYAQSKGYAVTGGVTLDRYPDAGSVAGYARSAMSWAVGNGIVGGTAAGTLNPAGTASRAHFAAFLHRFCTRYGIA